MYLFGRDDGYCILWRDGDMMWFAICFVSLDRSPKLEHDRYLQPCVSVCVSEGGDSLEGGVVVGG
jgi:hypothetical protein